MPSNTLFLPPRLSDNSDAFSCSAGFEDIGESLTPHFFAISGDWVEGWGGECMIAGLFVGVTGCESLLIQMFSEKKVNVISVGRANPK